MQPTEEPTHLLNLGAQQAAIHIDLPVIKCEQQPFLMEPSTALRRAAFQLVNPTANLLGGLWLLLFGQAETTTGTAVIKKDIGVTNQDRLQPEIQTIAIE